MWFNNKEPHGAVNLGEETRITFVFDMPHGQSWISYLKKSYS